MKPFPRIQKVLLTTGLLLMFLLPGPALAATRGIPLPARVALAKAGALIQKQAYQQALQILTAFQMRAQASPRHATDDPKGFHHPEIYFALGTCHLMLQAYGPAREAFEQAVRRNPGHVSAWLNLAKVCYETSDYSRAAGCFGQAYEQAADQKPEHLYYCAAAHLMAGENESSLAAFEKLFDRHAAAVQPAWRENFVQALLSADRAHQALPHIRLLAEGCTGDKQIRWQEILLYQYLQLGLQAQARDYALFLTGQAPTCARWWKALAHVELQTGRHEQALAAMTLFSFLGPLTRQETILLADLHLAVGIPAKAAPLFAAALASGTDTRLLHNLVLALQQLGRPEQALARLDQFAPQTKDADLILLRADLLYSLERFEEAGQAYRLAARNDMKKAGRAWLMAGYAALQSNDPVAGRRAFEKAARFDGHRKAALLALHQLAQAGGPRKKTPL